MTRLRFLLWLIALVAFTVPPLGTASAGHAMPPVEQMAAMDCADHAPPPKDCPDQGTAKHSAGQCCPSMVGCDLLLVPGVVRCAVSSVDAGRVAPARHLTGIALTKDPPPPRT